ncbi:MAG: pitrilysin family protein [Bacteroidetes bacterium]|nr:pitrilysin family protein [Bacteroidota bacterium]
MKNKLFKISSLLTIAILFVATSSNAQVDRTKAPAPNAAPIIKIGTPAKFVLPNGLKVFVVQNNKLPRVSASLTFNYDPILEGDKAGYVSLAGELIKQGTTTKKKEVLDEEVDFLGANLSTSASSASVNALSSNFNKAFGLMADVVLHPAFLESEFDRLKKQTLTGLEAEKEDPNSISSNVSNKLMYGANHPYGEFNTEATVKNITLADVKKYYNTYWKPNVAYLVFVGDITPANAQKLALQYFGKWQKGVCQQETFQHQNF